MLPEKDDEGRQVFVMRPGECHAVFHTFLHTFHALFTALDTGLTQYSPTALSVHPALALLCYGVSPQSTNISFVRSDAVVCLFVCIIYFPHILAYLSNQFPVLASRHVCYSLSTLMLSIFLKSPSFCKLQTTFLLKITFPNTY